MPFPSRMPKPLPARVSRILASGIPADRMPARVTRRKCGASVVATTQPNQVKEAPSHKAEPSPRVLLPDLIQLDHQVLHYPLYQYLVPIALYPHNVVHAPIDTVGLSSQFHPRSIPLSSTKTWEPDTHPDLRPGIFQGVIRKTEDGRLESLPLYTGWDNEIT